MQKKDGFCDESCKIVYMNYRDLNMLIVNVLLQRITTWTMISIEDTVIKYRFNIEIRFNSNYMHYM